MKIPRALVLFALSAIALAGCQTTATHQFAAPTDAWQTRTGQLAYKGPRISLIGELIVRSSTDGTMELSFTKGPGVTLMRIRQDAQFASAEGPLTHGHWSGPAAKAPVRLRGWFALREKILAGEKSAKITAGAESFRLRF
ncbi:MAG: hypothetical protein ACR2HH_11345 [Chthoniobacterales bacterium]